MLFIFYNYFLAMAVSQEREGILSKAVRTVRVCYFWNKAREAWRQHINLDKQKYKFLTKEEFN